MPRIANAGQKTVHFETRGIRAMRFSHESPMPKGPAVEHRPRGMRRWGVSATQLGKVESVFLGSNIPWFGHPLVRTPLGSSTPWLEHPLARTPLGSNAPWFGRIPSISIIQSVAINSAGFKMEALSPRASTMGCQATCSSYRAPMRSGPATERRRQAARAVSHHKPCSPPLKPRRLLLVRGAKQARMQGIASLEKPNRPIAKRKA